MWREAKELWASQFCCYVQKLEVTYVSFLSWDKFHFLKCVSLCFFMEEEQRTFLPPRCVFAFSNLYVLPGS